MRYAIHDAVHMKDVRRCLLEPAPGARVIGGDIEQLKAEALIIANIPADMRELPSITAGVVGVDSCLCAPATGNSSAEGLPVAINNPLVTKLKKCECHDLKGKPNVVVVPDARRPLGWGGKPTLKPLERRYSRQEGVG